MKFSELIGHDKLKIFLSKHVGLTQKFIFSGPPSIGKRTTAFWMAKYALCQGTKDDGCFCRSCLVFNGDHPDFLAVGRNGKILVNDIDKIIEFVLMRPLCSETKVVVIDNVDVISIEASNRLLKILEESNFLFFLITSQIKCVLPTIQSRCLVVPFQNLNHDDLVNVLWKKMGYELSQAQILGWIGSNTSLDVFSNAGLILKNRDDAMSCIDLIFLKDTLGVLDFIDRIQKSELFCFIDMLLILLTDILQLKYNIDDIVNLDKRDDLFKKSKMVTELKLILILSFLTQVKKYSSLNVNLNLALKSSMIKVCKIIGS